ncbi:MAG: hypothetical protein WBX27_15015, partial [Specibacter sp.]
MNQQQRLRRQWFATSIITTIVVGLVAAVAVSQQNPSAPFAGVGTSATAVAITDKDCGVDVANQSTGPATFTVHNAATWPTEVYLVKLPDFGTLFRTVVIGPGATVVQNSVLGPGDYAFQCLQG